MKKTLLALTVFSAILMVPAFAQSPDANQLPATYLKGGISYGNFTVDPYQFLFVDLDVTVEHNWKRRHGGLAGFSVGYRKEDLSMLGFGNFFRGMVFWDINTHHSFSVKPEVGMEWGQPSSRFNKTRFRHNGDTLVSYRYVYLDQNSWMPIGVDGSGTLYPVFQIGVSRKTGRLLFEGGLRLNYDKFGFITDKFDNNRLIQQTLIEEYKFIPTLFVGIGLKLF